MEANYIAELMARARRAQRQAEDYSQEQVRRIANCIAYLALNRAEAWANFNYEETKMGDVQSKINRTQARARGMVRDLSQAKTVGVIEVDEEKQLVKIGKPVGVVGALIPTTVPMGVVFIGAMNAIMGRNAMICSPHPRARRSTQLAVADIRKLFAKMGVPEDLLICIDEPSMAKTQELMRRCDLVIATGGAPMVKAAYSSGTPAFGVGAGNVVVVIDETADLEDAANKIAETQLNDHAIGCSTENAAAVQAGVYERACRAMTHAGAYICNAKEKEKLQNVLWANGHLNPDVICKPAGYIAQQAGIDLPADRTWLVVEETGYGPEYPFSGEKLSVVVTLYRYESFEEAIALVNGIQAYSGAGHSCGIHSFNEEHILAYAMRTKTCRVAVRMPVGKSNAGNWNNGMPFTINLGCGTWGGNITSDNVTYKNYINTTWVAREIPNFRVPTDQELFGDILNEKELFEGLI